MKWFYLLPLFISVQVMALDFTGVKCPEDQVLAEEILKAELQGLRNSFSKTGCLKQEDFPHFEVGSGLGFDSEAVTKPLLVEKVSDAKVVQLIPKEEGLIEAVISVKVGKKTYKDAFAFTRAPLGSLHRKELGCMRIDASPVRFYLLKACRPDIP